MKPKHTPGPWESHGDGIICKVSRATTDRVRIAVINGDTETARADARLIAAAPEMLEALKQLVTWYDGYRPKVSVRDGQDPSGFIENFDSKVNRYREIIAKAEGEKE